MYTRKRKELLDDCCREGQNGEQPAAENPGGRPRVHRQDNNELIVQALCQHAVDSIPLLAAQYVGSAYAITDDQLTAARQQPLTLVGGFLGRESQYPTAARAGRRRVSVICESRCNWRTLQQAADAIAAHSLGVASDVHYLRARVMDYKRKDSPLERPADERFLYRYSRTAIPTKAADFFDLTVGRPNCEDVPLFVWRKFPRAAAAGTELGAAAADGPQQEQPKQLGSFVLGDVQLVPWVVIDYSAAVPGDDSLGVYAWRKMLKGQLIGVYSGLVLNKPKVVAKHIEPLQQPEYNAMVELSGHVISGRHNPYTTGSSSITTLVKKGGSKGSRVLFDQEYVGWPGMFVHLANDARGRKGFSNNAYVTRPDGVMRVIMPITQVYNPFVASRDVESRLAANAQAEILWSYGDNYHEGSSS